MWLSAGHGRVLLRLLRPTGHLLSPSESGGTSDSHECRRRVWLLRAVLLRLVLRLHRSSL